jgi:hypothetical protein
MGHVDIAAATALRFIEDAHRSVVTIADHPVIAAQCEHFRRSRRNLFRPVMDAHFHHAKVTTVTSASEADGIHSAC